MLTKKMKKKQNHENREKQKRETVNDNNIKKETFWSLVILCKQRKGLSKKHVSVTRLFGGTSEK